MNSSKSTNCLLIFLYPLTTPHYILNMALRIFARIASSQSIEISIDPQRLDPQALPFLREEAEARCLRCLKKLK